MAKYVMFSPVSGVVLLNGAPVVGAKVERSYLWRWAKQRADDSVVTDAQGRFTMPEVTGSSMSAWLPHEPFVEQGIAVYVEGKRYAVWGHNRRNYESNSELSGKPLRLRIELSMEPKTYSNEPKSTEPVVGRFTLE